jgi:hypothetical protein
MPARSCILLSQAREPAISASRGASRETGRRTVNVRHALGGAEFARALERAALPFHALPLGMRICSFAHLLKFSELLSFDTKS